MSFRDWLARIFGDRPAAEEVPDDGVKAVDSYREPAKVVSAPPAVSPAPRAPELKRTPWPSLLADTHEHSDGGLAGARATRDVLIQGVPCKGDTFLSFHRTGRLRGATLARAHTIDGEALERDAVVRLAEDGTLDAWSGRLVAPRELPVRSKDGIDVPVELAAGTEVTIERGRLRAARLAAALSIDGVAFPAGTELTFGDSGSLSHACAPAELELEVHGVRFASHETVVFLFGHLHEGWPAGCGVLAGIPYAAGEIVRFHENGRLARCYLADDTEISGIECMAGRRIYLDEEGRLLEGRLARDAIVAGVPVAEDTVVALADGVPVSVVPCEECEIGGHSVAAEREVVFFEDGRLRAFTLAREGRLGGLVAPPGSGITLHRDGTPQLVVMTDGMEGGAPLAGTWSFYFRPDGTVRHRLATAANSWLGQLSPREPATIDGWPALPRTGVELSEDFGVRSVVLARDHRVGALLARRETRVHLAADGAPAQLTLAEDANVDGVPCRRGTTVSMIVNGVEQRFAETVSLHPNGRLSFATLARDAVVDTIPLAAAHTIARNAGGQVTVGTLSADWKHPSGMVGAKQTLLGLFDDGSPSLITLAEPFERDGTTYGPGTTLRFRAPGEAARPSPAGLGPVTPLD